MSKLVNDTYKFIGLDMIETINNWIKGVPPPAIFKTRNGESGNGNGEWGMGNGESLKWGIFKSGNL